MTVQKILLLVCLVMGASAIQCQDKPSRKVVKTYHINSAGGWDYIKVNAGKIYVSHSSQVNILDEKSGDSVGVIPGTTGVHGIAFDNEHQKGFTSNGRTNNVTVFDLKTNKVLSTISTGQNPDAIMFEPYAKTIITCNGRSNDLSIIDPVGDKVVATIALSGRPEEAISDGKGTLFVNLEDKSEVAVVSLIEKKEKDRYTLAPGEAPTGLAIDVRTHRLFSGCSDSKQLVVLDANTGKKVAILPIGEGCDGVVFDAERKLVYTSNGDGSITVIKEMTADKYEVVETIRTKSGARTIALEEKTHALFLPTADFEARDPKEDKRARRRMIPGSFQVLVVE
jgi:YVTN family beta-propeller protein